VERKERTILITIIANIVLVLLRFFLANISGSIGLAANAWHSITDVFVTTIVFIGLLVARIGAKKLSRTVSKVENALAIFVSLFIFYMGVEILSDALSNEGIGLRYVPVTAAGAFLGVIINYFMARYKIYVGEQENSPSLIADGYHSKMDMYCSIAVLVGIVGSLFGMDSLDKISAIIAMVFLMISGYEILINNFKALLAQDHPENNCTNHNHNHTGSFRKNKKMLTGVSAILGAAYLLSGVYFVNYDEVGIVRRFGALEKESATPGIHYRLPSPIDQVSIIKKDNIRKLELGKQELLTGDTNLLNVKISVHYKVVDAVNYALNVNNLDSLIKFAATTSIRQIVGAKEIDYLLTSGKSEIEVNSKDLLQGVLDKNNTGIEVVGVQLLEIAPPSDVLASFQDLASARQDKSVYINEALAYKNSVIPKANGEAYKSIKDAEGYKDEKVKTAEGDASLFIKKLLEYQKSKSVTEFRLYMEAMDKVLPNVQKILLGGNIKIDNVDLWITNNNAGEK